MFYERLKMSLFEADKKSGCGKNAALGTCSIFKCCILHARYDKYSRILPPCRFLSIAFFSGRESRRSTQHASRFTLPNRGGAIKSGIIERLQRRVARATGPYRPATRWTERVRRSFGMRRPFPTVRPAPLSRAGSPAGRASGPCHPCGKPGNVSSEVRIAFSKKAPIL
jgi:hypothetical protein